MICFDQDGVLAAYERDAYNFDDPEGPKFLQDGYFRTLKPNIVAINLLEKCIEMCPNDTYIITSIPNVPNKNKIIMDKLFWITSYIPKFNIGTQFIAPTDSKMTFIEWIRGSAITDKDILIDDYNPNLYSWMARGGTAIKYINGINHQETWVGDSLDGVMFDADNLFKLLMGSIVNRKF